MLFSKFFTQAGLLQLGNAIGTLKKLTHLAICDYLVIDDVLKAIGKYELQLTCLEVHKIGTLGLYTMKGLSALLNASRSLTTLEVHLPKLPPQLKRIQINTHNWFQETLFSLIENCRKLESNTISGDKGKGGSDIRVTPPQRKTSSVLNISTLDRDWRKHCGLLWNQVVPL